ncbi:MAG: hypothetical protein K8W52_24425 [Deltaproteobacteria bacterium]|nr:hypothetical protein [Deltaproteobacteria bacterium]
MQRIWMTWFVAGSLGLAACGGRSATSAPPTVGNTGGTAGAAVAHLPWEAALTTGKRFELVVSGTGGGGESIAVTVASVEDHGDTRVYHLSWGEGSQAPTTITVHGDKVLIGDAKPEEMKEPSDQGDMTCYGADYSNPEGCDDVCDADLCLSPAGIVGLDGLYAPNYDMFRAP